MPPISLPFFKLELSAAPLVAVPDQLEQPTRFGLILADVDDVIEDQQTILVELGERTFEGEPDGCRQMALASGAGRSVDRQAEARR